MTDIVERLRERLRLQLENEKAEWLAWDEKRIALERDAARYRWLRDVHTDHYTVTRFVGGALIPRLHGTYLDAAIDAAMKQ